VVPVCYAGQLALATHWVPALGPRVLCREGGFLGNESRPWKHGWLDLLITVGSRDPLPDQGRWSCDIGRRLLLPRGTHTEVWEARARWRRSAITGVMETRGGGIVLERTWCQWSFGFGGGGVMGACPHPS
jgi:hypothetical protein